MTVARYKFDTIFDYDAKNGILIPKYTVEINNTRLPKGEAVTQDTYAGGLDIFKYIGRPIYGAWDSAAKVLFIEGFF